ncbi:MAG: M48 family metallopeptidase [Gammaproteobacteria bacterium]|nr:M48 family metallopeptidase [Gammaproteobacteria bacterium]
MENVYKNEKTLFNIAFVLSLLFWLVLIVGTFGIALIYILVGFIFYVFVQSAFISYIKGTAVKVSENQFPDLYSQYLSCNRTLEMEHIPDIYILNSDGLLNALATRFLKKTYVILYSDIVDALTTHPRAINFYIGHELGHIKRGHIKWSAFLWPSMVLPLLGTAYSRAREYSCDLHGLACCERPLDAAFALSVLAAGPVKWSKINLKNYALQTNETGSFWMSYHELANDYPWLCKRVNHILSQSNSEYSKPPKRNIFA